MCKHIYKEYKTQFQAKVTVVQIIHSYLQSILSPVCCVRCFSAAAEKSRFHILEYSSRHARSRVCNVQKIFEPRSVRKIHFISDSSRVFYLLAKQRYHLDASKNLCAAHTPRDEFLCLAHKLPQHVTPSSLSLGKWHWKYMYIYKNGGSARQPNGKWHFFFFLCDCGHKSSSASKQHHLADPHLKFFSPLCPLKVIKPWEFFDVNFQFDIISHQRAAAANLLLSINVSGSSFFPSARREWWTRVLFALQLFTLPSTSADGGCECVTGCHSNPLSIGILSTRCLSHCLHKSISFWLKLSMDVWSHASYTAAKNQAFAILCQKNIAELIKLSDF